MLTYSRAPENSEDWNLVAAAKSGDDSAFEILIQRHRPWCNSRAYSILRDTNAAEDAVQTAFWKAYQQLADFRGEARFSSWLSRILINECLVALRRRRANHISLTDPDVSAVLQASPELHPDHDLAHSQVHQVLHQEIQRLPTMFRTLIVGRDIEERPMDELAQENGITVSALKSRLLRARNELRQRMARHLGSSGPRTLLEA